jgi:hypothetical protein
MFLLFGYDKHINLPFWRGILVGTEVCEMLPLKCLRKQHGNDIICIAQYEWEYRAMKYRYFSITQIGRKPVRL